jgi:putative copper resistance protein D
MPEGLLRVLLLADLVGIDLGLALVIGSLASDVWLWRSGSAWSRQVTRAALGIRRVGFVLACGALVPALWLEAAAMAEIPLLQAGPSALLLLQGTHFGQAWLVGLVAWLALGIAGWQAGATHGARLGRHVAACASVALFAATRSVVSHAGSQGDLSLDMALDWVHLLLVSLWLGIVCSGALLRLPAAQAPSADRQDAVHWVGRLSTTATGALVGIAATGSFKVWRVLPWAQALEPSEYRLALGVKLGFVALAIALGGGNRFRVLPQLAKSLRAGHQGSEGRWRIRLVSVLRVEAAVLLLALIAAVVLGDTAPPGS